MATDREYYPEKGSHDIETTGGYGAGDHGEHPMNGGAHEKYASAARVEVAAAEGGVVKDAVFGDIDGDGPNFRSVSRPSSARG